MIVEFVKSLAVNSLVQVVRLHSVSSIVALSARRKTLFTAYSTIEKKTRCLILGGFAAPDTSWRDVTTIVSETSFDSRLLIVVMEHASVFCLSMYSPTVSK